MLKKHLSSVLIALLIGGINVQINFAQTSPVDARERNRIEKIKTEVYRLGLGKSATAVVRLRNGAKLKGYISQAIEDSFDLTDPVTRGFTTIPYADVAKIEQDSPASLQISNRTYVMIGIFAGLIVLSKLKRKRGTSPRCPLFGC